MFNPSIIPTPPIIQDSRVLKQHHEIDDNITVFETWGEFKIFCRKDGKTVDDYISVMKNAKLK